MSATKMVEKTRINVALALPDVPDVRDACVRRLTGLIESREGVDAAHVVEAGGEPRGEVCIHFDPDRLSVGDVRDLARRGGAQLAERYGHLLRQTQPVHPRRANAIGESLRRRDGVLDSELSPAGVLRIEFDRQRIDEAAIQAALRELNVPLLADRAPQVPSAPPRPEEEEHAHRTFFGMDIELAFAVLSGAFLLAGWLWETLAEVGAAWWLGCYALAYVFGGFFTLREAVGSLRAGRFEIDLLMLVAAAGAAFLGNWAEGALLLFLFSLGHSLEHFAMGRARRAIEALAEIAPRTAIVRRGGREQEMAVESLEIGDLVIVKPNQRLPADGFVLNGQSAVDQSPVTGESVPVDKRPVDDPAAATERWEKLEPAHRVFAGTINGSGALEVQVVKHSQETTLARVVQLVAEAETHKSPTQRFTDRFERVFVPAVLGFVVLLLFAWAVLDEPFRASFYRAMAVLVAASPCALAIATPSAVLSAVARAGRGGLLVKGGGPLENLGRLKAIAFDKTGTLTEGKPRLTDVEPADGATADELLRVAVAVENLSDHPLAAAVVRDGRERLGGQTVPSAQGLESITGRGVKAVVDGQPVYIGKDDLFADVPGPSLPDAVRNAVLRLEADGRTTMIVRQGERYLGIVGLMDTPRAPAADVIRRLRDLGITRMVMISGDNQRVADAVARHVGLDEARGDLMPQDKVEAIKALRREADVAMVGDGVNDAPAMANATVGIAMGAAGSDVALETADVALMADDLTHLPFAVGLSRRTSRVIRQNLWMSLGMVAFLIPATLFGLRIGPAVALHEGSTIVVVVNALRLLAYRSPTP